MSEKIYSVIPLDFVRRMRNWARWWDGAGQDGISQVYALGAPVDRYREAPMPTLCGEAEDTDAALHRIGARYEQVVRMWWLHEGRSLREHARKRGVDDHTFCTWVICGHERLRSELAIASDYHRMQAQALQEIA